MRKSTRSEDKSIYLAFALSPSISFNTILDRQNSQDRLFHFELTKQTQILQTSQSLTIESMINQTQTYLYLYLPQYADKMGQNYYIKLVQDGKQDQSVLLNQKINLTLYAEQHKTQQKDFWTEIHKTATQTSKITIKQRVFLKRTKFQLQDIINSSQRGEEYDVVEVPDMESKPASKFGVDRRKSKSQQISMNTFVSPRRLDTISEEDSNIPLTDRKQRDSFGSSRNNNQLQGQNKARRMTTSVKKSQSFQHELYKRATWVEKTTSFNNDDDQFLGALNSKPANQSVNPSLNQNSEHSHLLNPNFDRLKVQSMATSEFSQKSSKISKFTKDSEQQPDFNENDVSFMEKSSLLMDMSVSELDITPNQQIYFKLKWVVLALIVLALAVVASMSTDAFNFASPSKSKLGKNKHSSHKNKNQLKQKKNKNSKKKQTIHP